MAGSFDPEKGAAWRGRFQRFARSELAVARFCAKERVSVASFYYWRKKLGPQGRPQHRPQPVPESDDAFQQVTVVPAATRAQASPLRLATLACAPTPEHAGKQKPTLIAAGT